jgi:dTDP-4-dehydrorhamnose 3,5-epimerase
MKFTSTPLAGAYVIDVEPREDERGFFARTFCAREFAEQGLDTVFAQINTSLSRRRGTLRGMHYQLAPHAEVKVVRCIAGALHDVILDVRRGSPTFGQSFGVELSAANRRMLYVPRGFAHGFITLRDETEAFYLVSTPYAPTHERGIRWDDPRFAIAWPLQPTALSEKDRALPDFDESWHLPAP